MALTIGSIVGEVSANIDGFIKAMGRVQAEIAKLTSGTSNIKIELGDKDLVAAIKRLDINVNNTVERIERAFSTIARLFDQLDGRVGNAGAQLKRTVADVSNSVTTTVTGETNSLFHTIDRFIGRINPLVVGTLFGMGNIINNIIHGLAGTGTLTLNKVFGVIDRGSGTGQKFTAIFTTLFTTVTAFVTGPTLTRGKAFLEALTKAAPSTLSAISFIGVTLTFIQRGINAILGRIKRPEAGPVGQLVRLINVLDEGLVRINLRLELLRSRVGIFTGVLVTLSTTILGITSGIGGLGATVLPALALLNTIRFIWSGIAVRVRVGFLRFRAGIGDGRAQFKLFLLSLRQMYPLIEAIAKVSKPLGAFISSGALFKLLDRMDKAARTAAAVLPSIDKTLRNIANKSIQVVSTATKNIKDNLDRSKTTIERVGASADVAGKRIHKRVSGVKSLITDTREEVERINNSKGFLGNLLTHAVGGTFRGIGKIFGGVGTGIGAAAKRPFDTAILGAALADVLRTVFVSPQITTAISTGVKQRVATSPILNKIAANLNDISGLLETAGVPVKALIAAKETSAASQLAALGATFDVSRIPGAPKFGASLVDTFLRPIGIPLKRAAVDTTNGLELLATRISVMDKNVININDDLGLFGRLGKSFTTQIFEPVAKPLTETVTDAGTAISHVADVIASAPKTTAAAAVATVPLQVQIIRAIGTGFDYVRDTIAPAIVDGFSTLASTPGGLSLAFFGFKVGKNIALAVTDVLKGVGTDIKNSTVNFLTKVRIGIQGTAKSVAATIGLSVKTREERIAARAGATGLGRVGFFFRDLFRIVAGSLPGAGLVGITKPEDVRKERTEAAALRRERSQRELLERQRIAAVTGIPELSSASITAKSLVVSSDKAIELFTALSTLSTKIVSTQEKIRGGNLLLEERDKIVGELVAYENERSALINKNAELLKRAGLLEKKKVPGGTAELQLSENAAKLAQDVISKLVSATSAVGVKGPEGVALNERLASFIKTGKGINTEDLKAIEYLSDLLGGLGASAKAIQRKRAGARGFLKARFGEQFGGILAPEVPKAQGVGDVTRLSELNAAFEQLTTLVKDNFANALSVVTDTVLESKDAVGDFNKSLRESSALINAGKESLSKEQTTVGKAFEKQMAASPVLLDAASNLLADIVRKAAVGKRAGSIGLKSLERGEGVPKLGITPVETALEKFFESGRDFAVFAREAKKSGVFLRELLAAGKLATSETPYRFLTRAKGQTTQNRAAFLQAQSALAPAVLINKLLSAVPIARGDPEKTFSRQKEAYFSFIDILNKGIPEAKLLISKLASVTEQELLQAGNKSGKRFVTALETQLGKGSVDIIRKLLGGADIDKSLSEQLKGGEVKKSLTDLLNFFRDFLEHASPPKKGPLRAAELSFSKFGPTIGDQMQKGKGGLVSRLNKFIQATFGVLMHKSPAGGLLGQIENSFSKFGSVVGDRLLAGKNVLQQSLMALVQQGFAAIPSALGSLVGATLAAPFLLLGKTIRTVGGLAGTVLSGIVGGVSSLLTTLNKLLYALPVFGILFKMLTPLLGLIGVIGKGLGNLVKFITGALASAIEGVGKAIGGMAKVAGDTLSGLLKLLLDTNSSILMMGRKAEQLRIPIKNFDLLSKAIEQTNVSSDEFAQTLLTLQRTVNQSLEGNKEMLSLFSRLGLSIDDLRRKRIDEIFTVLVRKLGEARDNTELFERGVEAMGASFGQMRTIVLRGGEDLRKALENVNMMGGIVSADDLARAEKVSASMVRMGQLVERIKVVLLDALGPYLLDAVEYVESKSNRIFRVIAAGVPAVVDSVQMVIDYISKHGIGFLAVKVAEALGKLLALIIVTIKNRITSSLSSRNTVGRKLIAVAGIVIATIKQRVRNAIASIIKSIGDALLKAAGNPAVADLIGVAQAKIFKGAATAAYSLTDAIRSGSTASFELEAAIDALGGNFDKAETRAADFRRELEQLKRTRDTAVVPMRAELRSLNYELEEAQSNLIYQRERGITGDPLEYTLRRIKQLSAKIADVNEDIEKASDPILEAEERFKEFAAATDRAVDTQGNLIPISKEASDEVANFNESLRGIFGVTEGAEEDLNKLTAAIADRFVPVIQAAKGEVTRNKDTFSISNLFPALPEVKKYVPDVLSMFGKVGDKIAEVEALTSSRATLMTSIITESQKVLELESQRISKLGEVGVLTQADLEYQKERLAITEEFTDSLGAAESANKRLLDSVLEDNKALAIAVDTAKNIDPALFSGIDKEAFVDKKNILVDYLANPNNVKTPAIQEFVQRLADEFGFAIPLVDLTEAEKQLRLKLAKLNKSITVQQSKVEFTKKYDFLAPEAGLFGISQRRKQAILETGLFNLQLDKTKQELIQAEAASKGYIYSQAYLLGITNKLTESTEANAQAIVDEIRARREYSINAALIGESFSIPFSQSFTSILSQAVDGSMRQSMRTLREEMRKNGQDFNDALYVVAKFGEGIFQSAMNRLIESAGTNLQVALTKVMTDVFGLAGELGAGVASGILAIGGFLLKGLQQTSTTVKDTVDSVVESTETVRGLLSGEATIKLKEVGEQLQEANRPIVERLDTMIAIMRTGTGFGGNIIDVQAAVAGGTP